MKKTILAALMALLATLGLGLAQAAATDSGSNCTHYETFGEGSPRLLNPSSPVTDTLDVDVAPGTYEITVVTYDDDHDSNYRPNQTQEQVVIMLGGEPVLTTDDIPDEANTVTTSGTFTVESNARTLQGVHLGEGNVNSVELVSVCLVDITCDGDLTTAEALEAGCITCVDLTTTEALAEGCMTCGDLPVEDATAEGCPPPATTTVPPATTVPETTDAPTTTTAPTTTEPTPTTTEPAPTTTEAPTSTTEAPTTTTEPEPAPTTTEAPAPDATEAPSVDPEGPDSPELALTGPREAVSIALVALCIMLLGLMCQVAVETADDEA